MTDQNTTLRDESPMNENSRRIQCLYTKLPIDECICPQCKPKTNYVHIDHSQAYFTSIEQIIEWLNINSGHDNSEIRKALQNTLKQGYQITKNGANEYEAGYGQGYTDASKEACQEIREHYHPNN